MPTSTDQVADLLEQLNEQIGQLMSGRRESIAVLHQVAIDLAVAIAGRILFTRIEADEFPLAQMIDELLNHVDAHESVTVLLNPQDHELLQQLDTSETGGHAVFEQVNWLASPDLPRGAARLDASSFALFYDPTIQLGEIRQSLLEILHEAEIERRQTGLPGQGLRRFPERRASG
ncbi:MAG: FliH/SctL family protein [Pirellulaceae bacterium]